MHRSQSIKPRRAVCAALLFCGLSASAAAQGFDLVGARALGMGGAFVAVADDATATYWNPAGIASGPFFNILADWTRVDSLASGAGQPPAQAGSGMFVALGVPPLGLSYGRFRLAAFVPARVTDLTAADREHARLAGPAAVSLEIHQVGPSFVQSLGSHLTVAATPRLIRGRFAQAIVPEHVAPEAALDQRTEIEAATRTTFDTDVGALATLAAVRVGLVVRNLGAPTFGGDREHAGWRLPRHARAGVALMPQRFASPAGIGLVVAADVDLTRTSTPSGERRDVAVGAERWWRNHRVGIRGGVRTNTAVEKGPLTGTIGGSLATWSGLIVEGHVTRGERGADRNWGIGLRLATLTF